MYKAKIRKAVNKRKSRRNKTYAITIYTDVIKIENSSDQYIDVYTTIKSLAQHQEYCKVFQQFSLESIMVKMFPAKYEQCPIIRISLSTYSNGGRVNPDLNSKGKTFCNLMKPESIVFTNSGRQNDFHYFFDTANLDVGPSCAVLLGNMADQNNGTTLKYYIQLSFTIRYRIPCLIEEQGKREMVEFKYKPKRTEELNNESYILSIEEEEK
jgi:hypothetical protein